jgi:hypothetical protein
MEAIVPEEFTTVFTVEVTLEPYKVGLQAESLRKIGDALAITIVDRVGVPIKDAKCVGFQQSVTGWYEEDEYGNRRFFNETDTD